VSRGSVGETSAAVRRGDGGGLSSLPAPDGVRLPAEEKPGAFRQGSSSGLGDLGGKGTRVASLPSTGPDVSGRGSGASSSGDGAGGGFGDEGPRAFGGGERPGRPSRPSSAPASRPGDGAGRRSSGLDSGIGLGGLGPGAGGTDTRARPAGGRGSGVGLDDRDGAGKRIARAELPSNGSGEGRRGPGSGSGAGSSAGPGIESGPRDFDDDDRRRTTGGRGAGSLGLGRGRGASEGNTDGRGVALPGGGSGGEEGPGKSGGGGEGSSLRRARTKPEGVYISTTGNFTLPGADYRGARRDSTALRKLMDELNSRTKVRVQLGGRYEPIARGSFNRAPVVVFTGLMAFELSDDQRQVLKEYVESGGMVWADYTRTKFDSSFRNEMEKIFGRAPATLPSGHAVYRSFYLLSGPPQGDLGNDDPFQGIIVGDRLGVIVTPNRYFSAISRSSSITEDVKEGAIQAVVNIYMYAAGNYNATRDARD
jgi:hypothetical protein